MDYRTFIEASCCCPQRTDRVVGSGFFRVSVRVVTVPLCGMDVDIGRSARGLKLCVVQSAATMPRVIVYKTSYSVSPPMQHPAGM